MNLASSKIANNLKSPLASVDDQPSTYQSCRCCAKYCWQAAVLQVNTVQDVYLQIVYLFEIIDEHCICFNVLMMTFGVIFESFFRNNFRCLFWTDGLMQWHFKDTAKHQSQEGWMACISYDTFIILARHQGLACAFWWWFNVHLGAKKLASFIVSVFCHVLSF